MKTRHIRWWIPLLATCLVGAAAPPKHFTSPEAAVQALVAAVKAHDKPGLLALLGTDAEDIVESGDPVASREAGERFVAAYGVAHAIDKSGDTQAVLSVGKDRWPLPIPLVKDANGWYFDGEAGEDEIVSRRIGRNELAAIQACLAFVDAEREYYARNPEGTPLLHYARKFASTAGKRDGLYYETREGEEESPLGELFQEASAEGYKLGQGAAPAPYHGYRYKILEGQGPKAPGGAYSYLAGDKMLGGFAMLAYPASYGVSGVMSFLVNHDGVVYETNLGKDTEAKAKAMTVFDLGPDTKAVPDPDTAPDEDTGDDDSDTAAAD